MSVDTPILEDSSRHKALFRAGYGPRCAARAIGSEGRSHAPLSQWWLLLEGAGEMVAGRCYVVPAASTTRGREGGLILDDVKAGGVTHHMHTAHRSHIIPLNHTPFIHIISFITPSQNFCHVSHAPCTYLDQHACPPLLILSLID